MHERLHVWVYEQLYPAFLGSFIVALALSGIDDPSNWGWGVLLSVYFMCQHGEGVIARRYAHGFECFGDVVEIVLMVSAFVALGLVPGWQLHPGWVSPDAALRILLFLIFVWPVMVRMLHRTGRERMKDAFYQCLGGLSVLAAIAAIGLPAYWSLGVVTLLLLTYIVAFLLFNDVLAAKWGIAARPTASAAK